MDFQNLDDMDSAILDGAESQNAILAGDGLDDFLPQDDEGKYLGDNGEEDPDDIFAGTDMSEAVGENNLLELGMDGKSEETSAYAQWEAEHRAALMEKRNTARAEKEELLERAKTDIQKFYDERKAKQTNAIERNKGHEENYFAEMRDLMAHGAPWEKVGRLVNLTPKPNEKPGTSKVGRMRRLLIQLKNEKKKPEEAAK